MPKVIVEPGRIQVLEAMSPYDGFVREFLATLDGIRGVLIAGYTAIVLGRSRTTEGIDMFVEPLTHALFVAWWARLEAAGFWCINARLDTAWALLQDHLAPRFAKTGTIEPNMEVKIPATSLGRATLKDAWHLDLLGQTGWIGDLSDQVAYKLYMGLAGHPGKDFPVNKDTEDALHIARVARHALDVARLDRLASILGAPIHQLEAFHDLSR